MTQRVSLGRRRDGGRREQPTFCRLCEPLCGLVATVEDGRLVGIRNDQQHALSQGFFCAKAPAMVDVVYDPDRVVQPLKRVGAPGEFAPVSWDEALDDIAARLQAIRDRHGPTAVATFFGNPPAFGFAATMWLGVFQQALGVKWKYSIHSEDSGSRLAANHLLYGSPTISPLPDLWRTDLAVLIGANPFVSKGSGVVEPRFRDALDSVVERGGRVVVIDPRRTETARRYEHRPLRAGTDAHLLLGMLHVLIEEGLVDRAFVDEHTTGFDRLAEMVRPYTPDRCAAVCDVPAGDIVQLARDIGTARSAVLYSRTGACTQRFGTLVNLLKDIVCILTGNLEREGGLSFGWGPLDLGAIVKKAGGGTYDSFRSRVTNMPEVLGMIPSTSLVPDILTPGEGQVRALMSMGCNPVLTSAGGGPELEAALEELDLHFSLDLYVNETNKHAHYVLPVTSMFEREDVPMRALGSMLRPTIWATDRVIEPVGQARDEWEILDEVLRRMGLGGKGGPPVLRRWKRFRPSPRKQVDRLIRMSPIGDGGKARGPGLSIDKILRRHPHGLRLRDDLPTGRIHERVRTEDGRIALALPQLEAELAALDVVGQDAAFPLRLIGMREMRSQNSWLHNAPRLMPDSRKLTARVSPVDAARAGVADGDEATITSRSGSVTVAITVTDDMAPGNIALPHGWGHSGGWQRANNAGGVCSNDLASPAPEDLEHLAGMSVLNGIPVRLERPLGRSGVA